MAKPKSKKRRKIVVFSILILILGGLAAAAVFRKNERVVMVQTEKVQRRDITETVVANGRIYPVFEVRISPEVSGEIIELPVKEGQTVHKGDLLLKIRPEEYVERRKSAEASYKSSLAGKLSSTANLTKSRLEYERIKSLHDTGLVSESDFLTAETTYEIAKAQLQTSTHQVEMAAATLSQADEDLAKTTILSPCDGTISKLDSRLGERVVGTGMMAGTEVMRIADLNEMEARVDIGEIDIVLIEVGQKAMLEVDAFKDREFAGKVTEIANSSKGLGIGGQSQEATKFEVKILITEVEAFRPGMTVTSEIETRSHTNVIAVPIASVTTRMPKPKPAKDQSKANAKKASATNETAGTEVAVTETNRTESTPAPSEAEPESSETDEDKAKGKKKQEGKQDEKVRPVEVVFIKEGDRAKMVPVELGISDDTHWEITEGLEEGQEVVSGGYKAISRDLEDGMKVRVGLPGGPPDTGEPK